MAIDIPLARTISIRDAGHNEYWLQNRIAEEPACLNLGDLEVVQRERRQATGGRLDLLLKDPESDTMYEVEIMLGETDESHIIRTIEYWDNERRKWPKRHHIAVILAEGITTRFYNVIHLLSHALPLIAIQATLIQTSSGPNLHFVTILDTYEEPEIEDAGTREPKNEAYWREKAVWTLDTAIALRDQVATLLPVVALRYNQDHIVVTVGDKPYLWLHKRSSPKSYLAFRVNDQFHGELDELLGECVSLSRRDRWVQGKVDKQFIADSGDLLRRITMIIDKSVKA